MKRALAATLLLCALATPLAAAQGWRTTAPAALYDKPSANARGVLVLGGHYPLKQIGSKSGWRKVATPNGDSGWIQQSKLARFAAAVVISSQVTVREGPNPATRAVFRAKKGVILQVVQKSGNDGWLQVRHPDGEAGFARASELWQNQ